MKKDYNNLKPLDYKSLKELETFLDFIAPVDPQEYQKELSHINQLEKELYYNNNNNKVVAP